ncbi:MAG: hypothetical protein M3N14_08335 [Bacteroidota bacterium]|nr:hypothetical protein [Bacteroidota bacterium]
MKNSHPVKIACNVIGLLALAIISAVPGVVPPEARITNTLIHVNLYLPDADYGYYRATRFDWSGVINNLEFNGDSYYGKWFEIYNPFINDAIVGPVEAFDPVGYSEAKQGEGFIKIGVGVVAKINDAPYDFATFYPIINRGKWKVKVKSDQVMFEHKLAAGDFAYDYIEKVMLIKNKPIMVLSHTLKNTGTKPIETSVFDHNFMVIDKQATGPGLVFTFPSNPVEKMNFKTHDLAKLQDDKLIFLKDLNGRFVSFKDLTNGNGANYCIKVENHHTGAGVKITGDRHMSRLAFWSSSKTACPEPYIKIKIAPGQMFTWNITYEYYDCDINKT